MKKAILTLFVFSCVAACSIAKAKPAPKYLPTVFKLLQKPSYRQVMAKIQAAALGNSFQNKQSVKDPYLIYTQLWDTTAKTYTDTFEKYTITWDQSKKLQSIEDISWDSVNNGAVLKSTESNFSKVSQPISIDNNVSVNDFPGNIVNQELVNGKWVNEELEIVSFDNNGRITSVLAQQWTQNAWVDYVKYEISYDSKGDFTELLAYYSNSGSWVLLEGVKVDLSFDSNGFITELLQSTSTGGSYINNLKETFADDNKGTITSALLWTYDSLSAQWTKYDSISNMSWLSFDPIMRIDYQTLNTVGIFGVGGDKYLSYIETKYDSLSSKWGFPERNIYTYNTDSLPTNILNQNLTNNAWVNNTSDTTTYYPGGDTKTYLSRYWTGSWHTSTGNNNVNTYDTDDDITESVVQNTDPFNAANFANYSKTEYLYNNGNSGIEPVLGATYKIYPNPVSGQLNIDMGQNISNGTFTITDISGKTVQVQQVENSNTGQVDLTGLQNGLYFLSINNGIAVSTVKFIKN